MTRQLFSFLASLMLFTLANPLAAEKFPHWLYDHWSEQANCDFGSIRFVNESPSSRLSFCRQLGPTTFSLGTYPESKQINPSPWYKFSVYSEQPQTLTLYLHARGAKMRYPAYISSSQQSLNLVKNQLWVHDKQSLKLVVEAKPTATVVSANQVIQPSDTAQWMHEWVSNSKGAITTVGTSVKGEIIQKYTQCQSKNPWVIIIGRQHPPEVNGAVALKAFVDTLLESKKFLSQYCVAVYPMLNPDGVWLGNWRLNAQGIDLNRDWFTQTQPETSFVYNDLRKLTNTEQPIALGIDFHSTWSNKFIYQSPAILPKNSMLVDRWIDLLMLSAPTLKASRKTTKTIKVGTFKNLISQYFQAPAITYEIADSDTHPLIIQHAETSALALITTITSHP